MVSVPPSLMPRPWAKDDFAGPIDASGVLTPLGSSGLTIDPASFLGSWQERNALSTIPHCVENLESSGVLHNFRRIADAEQGEFRGIWFADSDLYKTLEAIGWESMRLGHAIWTGFVDTALDLVKRAQAPDGYLNTHVQGDPTKERWSNLVWSHELYCAGHLFQAAVALSRGSQDDRLLEVALAFATRMIDDLEERPEAFDGHAEVETALVELYRLTGRTDLLEFAEQQVERRGHGRLPKDRFGAEYFGDHTPFRHADEATGHAVRQLYFATGLVDLYLEDGDQDKLDAAERLWVSAYSRKTYVTGGQGSRHTDESFGDDYELPADRAYAETCAAIASFHWNWRMLLVTGHGKYAAEMESALYNTVAASVHDDGCHFFYTNPLQMRTGHRGVTENSPSERLSWFECACCPPNLARLIASLDHYLATRSDTGVQIHLLTPGTIRTDVGGCPVLLEIDTAFPWNGGARITVSAETPLTLAVRAPEATARIDGQEAAVFHDDGYIRIEHTGGTRVIELDFAVAAAVIEPNPRIDAARGCVALKRGPFVYCLEGIDNDVSDAILEDLRIVAGASLHETSSALPSVDVALTVDGIVERPLGDLYGEATVERRPVTLTAIPYFAWGNRGRTSMRVWIPASA